MAECDPLQCERLANASAVILVGGRGRRLASVVSDRPKPLAPVRGRPFIAYLLDRLAEAKIPRAVLCTGYLGREFMSELGVMHRGMELRYSHEDQPLGTAGAIRHALPLVESDPLLVLNGDSICDADLEALWSTHREHQADATFLLLEVDDTARYGAVGFEDEGRLTVFREKLPADTERGPQPGWINAGVYVLTRELVEMIPPDRAVSLENEMVPHWLARRAYGCPSQGRFLDIGTPESYASAQPFLEELR